MLRKNQSTAVGNYYMVRLGHTTARLSGIKPRSFFRLVRNKRYVQPNQGINADPLQRASTMCKYFHISEARCNGPVIPTLGVRNKNDVANFDPTRAKENYVGMDDEELVRIAFIEESYLPEARDIAVAELERRNTLQNKEELIRKVRQDMAYSKFPSETPGQRSIRKFEYGVYVAMIWGFAAALPFIIRDPKTTMSALWWLLIVSCWLFFGIVAFRKWRKGYRRPLYLIVFVPFGLLTLSSALNMLI